MSSIDHISNPPVTPHSPKTPRQLDTDDDEAELQRPAKRQKPALFLSDSDDDGAGSAIRRGVVKAPPPAADPGIDQDVEALFADAENDEALSFKRIGDLDVAAMEKEAEERHRRAMPLTPHPVMPSSSPARDDGTMGNSAGGSKGTDKDKGKEKESKKRPRPVPLNENLLLGPTGFPDLISQLKDFKVKGKGREVEDLTRLMRVYNFWTHKLHPKLKFRDTVLRIEKLCHSRRLQVALSVWRDEAKGTTREFDADLSLDSDVEDNEPTSPTVTKAVTRPSGNATSESPSTPHSLPSGPSIDRGRFSLPPSSRASSQQPTSDFPDDDDIFGPSTSSSSRACANDPSATSISMATKKRIVVDDDDDEENLWKELEAARALQPMQRELESVPVHSLDDLDDEEMWAALEDATKKGSATSATAVSGNGSTISAGEMDIDDDDMWNIIRENERASPPGAVGPTPAVGNQSLAESEMDWDDMYAS